MPEFVDIVDFTNAPSINFVLQQSAPAAPVSGSKYFNPADGHEYVYTGAAWVATGQIANSGPVTATKNNDGTFSVSVATATTTSAGLLTSGGAALLGTAGSTSSGSLVLYTTDGGLTANVTGNLVGTATNATTLNGQTSAFYLNPANLTGGVAPISAGGTGLGTIPAAGQILIGDGSNYDLGTISAGPGLYTVTGPGTISIGISGGVSAPVGAAYLVIGGNDPSLTNERSLTGAVGQITLTDGGANSTATIGLSAVTTAGVQQPKVTVDVYGRVLSSSALTSGDIPSIPKSKISDFVESDYVHTTGDESVAGNKSFTQNVSIAGNLTVGGTTTVVSSQQLTVKDNLITVNSGEVGAGVTNISAGIEVDRGSSPDYYFAFFEDSDTFRIGQSGSTQAVATRVDAPVSGAFMAWDSSAFTLRDVPGFTVSTVLTSASSLAGGKLVAGSVPNSALTNSSLTVSAGTGLTGGGTVSLGGTTTLSLAATGTAGTYTKVTTDAYGRVLSGTTLTSGDLPAHTQAWSTITGTPTTLGGYGITDAVSAGAINQTIGGIKNFSLTPTVSGSYTVYHSGNLTASTLGAVTSVGLTAPSIFTVTGSPVTGAGTLALGLTTQISGRVFAGPSTGAAAAPTFRSLVATDIPALDFSKITTGVVPVTQGGTGATTVSGARIALSAAAIATASIVGNNTTSSYAIANPFGNANVMVQVVRSQGAPLGRVVIPTITINQSSPFGITVGFGSNVPNGTNYTVIMTGVGA